LEQVRAQGRDASTVLTVAFIVVTFSVGFSDASDVRIKRPDDDNVVWVGHRYALRLEAEAMAGAIQSRIKAS